MLEKIMCVKLNPKNILSTLICKNAKSINKLAFNF